MQIFDIVNGSFELFGAYFTWMNFLSLKRDKQIKGIYWPTTMFFAVWGMWNLIYYPALDQWFSFWGGAVLVGGNLAWVALAVKYLYFTKEIGNENPSTNSN